MIMKVKKAIIIKEGKTKGIITNISHRNRTFEYIDLSIDVSTINGEVVTLRAGYPAVISKKSLLGKVIESFGVELVEDAEIDIHKILIGKMVSFEIKNEKTQKGEFAKIITSTMEPFVKQEKINENDKSN